jgi:hypothetical protein
MVTTAIVFALAPVTVVPVEVVMPRTVVHDGVTPVGEATFPEVDIVQLPPGEVVVVLQRRPPVPAVEGPVVMNPALIQVIVLIEIMNGR